MPFFYTNNIIRKLRFIACCTLLISAQISLGQVIWSSPTGSAWMTGSNWSGGIIPSSGQTAQFDGNPASATTGIGINMDTASGAASAGAIFMSSARSNNLIIGNSSPTTPGVLTLTGDTISGIPHVVLANFGSSFSSLTVKNTQGSGGSTLGLNIGSLDATILSGAGTTTALGNFINLSTSVSGTGSLLFYGGGTWDGSMGTGNNGGLLKLAANNSFTGGVTIGKSDGTSSGILELDSTGGISNTTGNDLYINPNSQLLMAGPTGSVYNTGNIVLNLNGLGNGYTNTGKGALANMSGNNYTWTGAVNLQSNAGITVLNASGTTMTISGNITGSGQLIKYGAGNLIVSGTANSWTGGTQITNGKITVNSLSSLSNGPLVMTQTGSTNTALTLNNTSQTISSLSSSLTGTSNNNTIVLGGTALMLNQDSNTVFGGPSATAYSNITGTGSLVKTGNGRLTLTSANNSFSGGLTITHGEIRLNPTGGTASVISGPDTLNGGTLSTNGINRGFTFTLGTLALTENSTIDLGIDTLHLIKFAASNTISWTSGKVLTITHWSGSYSGSTGTRGRIYFGTGASGITATQLAQIRFDDGAGNTFPASILSTGEIVPTAPVITTTAATFGPYCNNVANNLTVAFTATGPFTGAFKVQLSSAAGVFTNDFTTGIIGSGTASPITATIPAGTTGGTLYRVRVINQSPVATFGSNNGTNIPLTGATILPAISGPDYLAIGNMIQYSDATTGGSWSSTNNAVATTTSTGIVTGVSSGTDTIIYSYTNSCGISSSTSKAIRVVPVPVITTVSPNQAVPGTTITINGSNFNTTLSANVVFFGLVRAAISAGSTTSLTVTAPANAAYFPVSVTDTITGLTATETPAFMPVYDNSGLMPNAVNFKPAVTFAAGSLPIGDAIGDLDGDGKPDLVVVNSGLNNIGIYRNLATGGAINGGSFDAPITISTSFGPHYVKIMDLDGDGRPEIVVTNTATSTNKISIYRNISTSGSISFAARVDIATGGSAPFDLTMADFDLDGKTDIAITNQSSDKVAVLRNVSLRGVINTNSFAAAVSFTTGSTPFKVYAGDLDGDGKPDIAVANYGSNTISVFHNTATTGNITSGSFATASTLSTGTAPSGIAVGDIDGDGKPELVVTNSGANFISVFRNTYTTAGTLSFATPVTYMSAAVPEDLCIGDINGDGKADIVCSNYLSNLVSVYRNTATSGTIDASSFAPKSDFRTGSYPAGISLGDLDGDGKPDIAIVAGGGSAVSILKNYPLPPNAMIVGADSICLGTSTTLTDSVSGGTWVSKNPAIATVSTTGVVTSVSGGVDTILYYTVAQGDTNYASFQITIDTYNPVGPVISPAGSFCLGALLALTDSASGGIWTSNNPTLASVDSVSGYVTGHTTGSTIITYTIANTCATTSDTIIVNVQPSTGYTIGAISGAAAVCLSSSTSFTDTSSGGAWSSSDTTIARVSGSGIVTGISPGTTLITYGFTGSCGTYLTTKAIIIDTIIHADSITGASSVCAEMSIVLSDMAGSGGIWLVSNAHATITSSGLLTGVSGGTDTVFYAMTNTCGTSTGTKTITINPAPYAGTITGPSSVCVSGSITLSDTTYGGTWSKSNTRANVSATGVVTGVSGGIDTIRYIKTNGCGADTATTTITVLTLPFTGVITGASAVCLGASTTLRDTVVGGIWSSKNGKLTVADSVITGIGTGTDTVLYTLTNTCGSASASKTIVINPISYVDTISGPSTLCTGSTITLGNAFSGGVWSKTNNKVNITAAGVVTGITAGLDTIKYTIGTTCPATAYKVLTITQRPSAGVITGSSSVCVGASIVLKDSITGGTWSNTNHGSTFTDSVLTGTSAGSDTITYTISNECGLTSVTRKITINPLPFADTISGVTKLFAGEIIPMKNPVAGGIWTVVNANALITVDGKLGGLKEGTDTVLYIVTNVCGKDTAYLPVTIFSSANPYAINEVQLYPNPGKGIFTFKISSQLDQTVSVVISNPLFRAMNLLTVNTNTIETLNMEDVPAGVYFFSVVSLKGWYTVKFEVIK